VTAPPVFREGQGQRSEEVRPCRGPGRPPAIARDAQTERQREETEAEEMIRLGLGPQAKPERPKSTQPSKPTTARATASSSAAEGVAAPAPVALHGVSNTGRSIVLDTSHTMDASAASILLKIQAPSRPHSTIRRQAVHVESLASHAGAGGGSTGSSSVPPSLRRWYCRLTAFAYCTRAALTVRPAG
jgi:hypothetical protein